MLSLALSFLEFFFKYGNLFFVFFSFHSHLYSLRLFSRSLSGFGIINASFLLQYFKVAVCERCKVPIFKYSALALAAMYESLEFLKIKYQRKKKDND